MSFKTVQVNASVFNFVHVIPVIQMLKCEMSDAFDFKKITQLKLPSRDLLPVNSGIPVW